MSQSNSNKYYHNDYKKQMGIDDTRSASQKLLDKVVLTKNTARKDRAQIQREENIQNATKKIKQISNQPITNRNVLDRLSKSLKQQASIQKLLKSIQTLYKCLNDLNFMNDPQINKIQTWLQIIQILRLCINKKYFYSSQCEIIMENIADCLSIIEKNLRKLTQIQIKIKQQLQKHVQLNNLVQQCLQKLQIEKIFCRLFTDDTFVFNNSLKTIKQFIFTIFQQSKNSLQAKNKQKQEELAYQTLMNLLQFPIKNQWIKTGLSQFLKQFNISHKEKLQQSKRSVYLKEYNIFLQKKCSNFNSNPKNQQSFNMMQKSSGGIVKSLQISQGGTGAQKWISKQ